MSNVILIVTVLAVALAMGLLAPGAVRGGGGRSAALAAVLAFCGVLAVSQVLAEDLATGLAAGAVAALAVALPPVLASRRTH